LAADTAQVNITVNKVNHPPVFTAIADTTINESEQLLLTIEASDPDGDNLTITAASDETGSVFTRGANFSNGSFTWTPVSTDIGVNLVEFFVQDQDGLGDTLKFKISVNVTGRDIQVPVELSDIDPQIMQEREYWEFEIPVASGERDSLIFWVENLPPQATFDAHAGIIKWTPGFFQSGIYCMVVGAHDGSFTDSRNLDVVVMEKDVPPVLFADQDKTIQEGDNLSLELAAIDSSGDRLSFSASGLPANAQLTSSGLLSYTPDYGEAGNYSVTLTVTDPAGNTDVSNWTLNVMHKNRPPVINAESREVEAPRWNWGYYSATDPDGDEVTLTVPNLPYYALFEESTGKLRVRCDSVGTYPITFYADDGKPGGKDSTTIYYIAGHANRPPQFGPVAYSRWMLESRKYTYSFEVSDPEEDDKIEIGRHGTFPDGFEVTTEGDNPVKVIWTWTPSYRIQGEYYFTFFAKDDAPYRLVKRKRITLTFRDQRVAPFFTGDLEGTGWLELSVDENSSLEVDLTAEALDDAPFNFNLVNNPPNISISERDHPIPDIMVCTPDYSQAGVYEFFVELNNGYYQHLKRIRLTVNDVNRPPSVPPIGDQSVNEGEIITFQVDAIDPDGDAFSVYTAGRVPFLTAGSNPPARIRDGNVFIFDTELLPADQQIESAVFLFWAEDVRSGVSDTVQVEIAVVRQDSTQVSTGGTMLAAVDTLTWDGMGISISLDNNSGNQLSGNVTAYEKSGFINPSAGFELPLLAGASKIKQQPGLYTFLAGEFTSQFYSLRRGWGINMQALANSSHPDSLTSGLGATVTVSYLQDDLPVEIPNFTEDRMRVFGFNSNINNWVLAEGQSMDTLANSATFMLTNPLITEYTLGASIDVIPPEIGTLQIKGGSFTLNAAAIDTMYNLEGSYEFRVAIDDDEALSTSQTEALLYYAVGSESFSEVAMTRTSEINNTFSVSVSLSMVESGTDISYYIVARDEMNEVLMPAGAPSDVYHLSLLEYTGKPGDIDQNITINIFDVLELLKVLGGSVEESPASDVNLDGKTDIFDVLELLKLLATG
jgi:PKD repeat protein